MQAPQCAGRSGARLIILHEPAGDAQIAQALLVKGLAEPAARVNMTLGRDNSGKIGRNGGTRAHDADAALLNSDRLISNSSGSVSNKIWPKGILGPPRGSFCTAEFVRG